MVTTTADHAEQPLTVPSKPLCGAIQQNAAGDGPRLEVVVEIPRGSFLKRGSTGQLDFISPFPCPFNYGSAHQYIGLEGDLLDAVILGPRLRCGTKITLQAVGAVGLADRGMYDDKIVCSHGPLSPRQRSLVLLFFRFYAKCKRILNCLRGQPGRTACEGWFDAEAAIARAVPRQQGAWKGPVIPF